MAFIKMEPIKIKLTDRQMRELQAAQMGQGVVLHGDLLMTVYIINGTVKIVPLGGKDGD